MEELTEGELIEVTAVVTLEATPYCLMDSLYISHSHVHLCCYIFLWHTQYQLMQDNHFFAFDVQAWLYVQALLIYIEPA